MVSLAHRSQELEMMDVEGYSFEDLKSCLVDIEKINRWTQAHRKTIEFVERTYLEHRKMSKQPMRILDVGFGSGDLLRQLSELADQKGYFFELVGVELNPWSCVIAEEINDGYAPIRFEHRDFLDSDEVFDVIVSSLVTHHMSSGQIVEFFQRMSEKARTAWYVHDLHRHVVPYYFVRSLSRWKNLHRMVQFDAPLSVARGFRRCELEELIVKASVDEFDIQLKWELPFKYCIFAKRKGLP